MFIVHFFGFGEYYLSPGQGGLLGVVGGDGGRCGCVVCSHCLTGGHGSLCCLSSYAVGGDGLLQRVGGEGLL